MLSLNICQWHSAWRLSDATCCEIIKLTKYPCILISTWITVTSRTVAFHQNFSAGIICDIIILFFTAMLFPTSGSLLQMTAVWTSNFTLNSLLQCLAPLVWGKKSPLWQSICSVLLNLFSNRKHILCSSGRRKYFTTCQIIKWFLWLSALTSSLLLSSGIKIGRREEKKTSRPLKESY